MLDEMHSTICAFTGYLNDFHQASATPLEPTSSAGQVLSRLAFVVRAALRVTARHEHADIELLGLIQEGNIALLEAVQDGGAVQLCTRRVVEDVVAVVRSVA